MNIEELAKYSRIDHIFLELTTDCNMRCTYCGTSEPDRTFETMPNNPKAITEFVKQNFDTSVSIQLNGHGETTILPWWTEVANELLDYRIGIITNMVRSLNEHELLTMSKFAAITVSVDVPDPLLHRQIRRGGNLENIMLNMKEIRKLNKAMHFKASAVCHNVFLDNCLEFLDWIIKNDFNSAIICHMNVMEKLKNICNVNPPNFALKENIEKLKTFVNLAAKKRFNLELQGPLYAITNN